MTHQQYTLRAGRWLPLYCTHYPLEPTGHWWLVGVHITIEMPDFWERHRPSGGAFVDVCCRDCLLSYICHRLDAPQNGRERLCLDCRCYLPTSRRGHNLRLRCVPCKAEQDRVQSVAWGRRHPELLREYRARYRLRLRRKRGAA